MGCTVLGQQPQGGTSPPAKSTAQADLTNLLDAKIKAEWQAIKTRDQKAYGDLLTDDYVAVEADSRGDGSKWKPLGEPPQTPAPAYPLSFLKLPPLCSVPAFVPYEALIRFPPKSVDPFE